MRLSGAYPEPQGLIVRFTADELAAIAGAASLATKQSANIVNRTRRDMSKSQSDADWIGLAGEYAVAKLFGLKIQDCGMVKKGLCMDGGHDLTLPNWSMRTVQVKTKQLRFVSALQHQRFDFVLEGSSRSEFKSDFGILAFVYPCKTQVNLAGYITREEFLAMGTTIDLGTGVRACVPLSRMHPVEELIRSVYPEVAHENQLV